MKSTLVSPGSRRKCDSRIQRDTDLEVICIDVNLKIWENLRLFRVTVYCEKNKRTLKKSYIERANTERWEPAKESEMRPERQFVEPG